MSPYDKWKLAGQDYIDEPEQNFAGEILTAPRDPEDDSRCLLCDRDALCGVLCEECDDEQRGRVYVSHEHQFLPHTTRFVDFTKRESEIPAHLRPLLVPGCECLHMANEGDLCPACQRLELVSGR